MRAVISALLILLMLELPTLFIGIPTEMFVGLSIYVTMVLLWRCLNMKFKMVRDVITRLADLNAGELVNPVQACYGKDDRELVFVLCQAGYIHVVNIEDLEVT
jgi:hypothetical protein